VHAGVLRSPRLEVTLDRDDALPCEYRLLSNQTIIHGENSGRAIGAAVFRDDPREFRHRHRQASGGDGHIL